MGMKGKDRKVTSLIITKGGRQRAGKGFSIGEIKEAGLSIDEAKKLGIYIDKRRRSKHDFNVKALKNLISRVRKTLKKSKGKAGKGQKKDQSKP
jgi:large subunit ribosomal protein L13e